ncbi:pyridoxamine 5'-phosphate oxidase [Galbitalea sp. SE-J8]|uniref:pyridoxamine 5'-phosphate oxidase n=1 Tax=Galbitalea sp. SE-J8 TaxID=3054952 RepID=UPI00259CA846|nr:pyridoxamine 5'-phosphate oxidase [Galbitalea sp. SE-J8]MDM4764124.1 pyridoxamine 5'-phosphate oxidase [Galbitalea sp. SE-J8]
MTDPLVRRTDYALGALAEADLDADPLVTARRWLADAASAESAVSEPNAMVVSTVDPDGDPSSRTVLLRGLDRGLVFFSHRTSEKGRAIAAHPVVSLLFPWYPLQRQLIVRGTVEPTTDAESDAYWTSRPWGSRTSARASRQSEPIASRAALEAAMDAEQRAHPEGGAVPRPAEWGGFRVIPSRIEFWQGRRSRLHDRVRFSRAAEGEPWEVVRLQP